jgi:hypothetical protein
MWPFNQDYKVDTATHTTEVVRNNLTKRWYVRYTLKDGTQLVVKHEFSTKAAAMAWMKIGDPMETGNIDVSFPVVSTHWIVSEMVGLSYIRGRRQQERDEMDGYSGIHDYRCPHVARFAANMPGIPDICTCLITCGYCGLQGLPSVHAGILQDKAMTICTDCANRYITDDVRGRYDLPVRLPEHDEESATGA